MCTKLAYPDFPSNSTIHFAATQLHVSVHNRTTISGPKHVAVLQKNE